jgi:VCBS repeat-containing protein
MIPDDRYCKNRDKIFEIVSVTQAKYGRVGINSNGSFSYRPNAASIDDSFEVTIRNSEGNLSVKKVNVLRIETRCDFKHDI